MKKLILIIALIGISASAQDFDAMNAEERLAYVSIQVDAIGSGQADAMDRYEDWFNGKEYTPRKRDAFWAPLINKEHNRLNEIVNHKPMGTKDFSWHLADAGTQNGWKYLRGEWKGATCDRAIIALYDANDNFLQKFHVSLDFGTFESLVIDANVGRRAKHARIKCN